MTTPDRTRPGALRHAEHLPHWGSTGRTPERAYGAQSGTQSTLGRSRSRRQTYPAAEQNTTA